MLDSNDIQTISDLLDKKLEIQKSEIINEVAEKVTDRVTESVTERIAEKVTDKVIAELGSVISDAVSGLEAEIAGIKEELAKKPNLSHILDWNDNRIIPLEVRVDRHDYIHIDELDKLPKPNEISRFLVERGFKKARA